MKFIGPLSLILVNAGILTGNSAPTETAVRWVSKSKEYQAVCQQTYASAWEKVKEGAKKTSSPWAVVMDIDETLLNNSQYQIELNAKNASHSQEAWEAWVNRTEAKPVPGAKEFILKMRGLPNGRIIFLSNRFARNTEATRRNLQKHDLTAENDVFLLRKDKTDTKANRQREVAAGSGRMAPHVKMKILAWFGDAAHDFPDHPQLKWGSQKFMLPNPVYGNW